MTWVRLSEKLPCLTDGEGEKVYCKLGLRVTKERIVYLQGKGEDNQLVNLCWWEGNDTPPELIPKATPKGKDGDRWVKFSEAYPTEYDADEKGYIRTRHITNTTHEGYLWKWNYAHFASEWTKGILVDQWEWFKTS